MTAELTRAKLELIIDFCLSILYTLLSTGTSQNHERDFQGRNTGAGGISHKPSCEIGLTTVGKTMTWL